MHALDKGTLVHASRAPDPKASTVFKGLYPNYANVSPGLPISDAKGLIRRAQISLQRHHIS